MKSHLLLFLLLPLLSLSQSTANYDISLSTIWTTEQHMSVPNNAHWSPLVGATHNTTDEFMSLGALATLGVKNVAEFGNSSEFENEINDVIFNNNADQFLIDGFSPFAGNNSNANFSGVTISEDFPLISLIAMVAPSPDWFIAINSLNLRSGNPAVNNGWKDTFTLDVFAYDSGTDDGTNYTSENSPNTPVGISMINGDPINGNKMATITFTYNFSTLSNSTFEVNPQFNISPNPTDGIVKLVGLDSGKNLVSIYTVLGKQVFNTLVSENLVELNLTTLKSGVYIVKISNEISKKIKTKKLIIK